MDKLEKTIKGLETCLSTDDGDYKCERCPYKNTDLICIKENKRDALELLKEQRKTKDEILLAIVSAIGYESVDDFKKTAEEVGTLDEFVFGMYRSINAVEKLFEKDGEQE